jgi:hypothetical protein
MILAGIESIKTNFISQAPMNNILELEKRRKCIMMMKTTFKELNASGL